MADLIWARSETGSWPMLQSVDPKSIRRDGVYMIWHEGAPGRVVCVGYGDVGEQLASERQDPSVLACEMFGPLRVTWAAVMPSERAGVARYLVDYWNPLLGDGGVTAPAVEANPPFVG